jgi:O-antigen/teichoic acid export membrane protein
MSFGEFLTRALPRSVTHRINNSPLARRLARGAFWTLVGAAAARILRIPISVFLARFMGPTKYGELGIASASIDLFGMLAGLGLGMTATKYVAELRVKDPTRAGAIIAISTVVATVGGGVFAVALFVFAPWLAAHTLGAPQLTVPLRIGSLALFFSSINGAQSGALFGFEAFHVVAKLQAMVGVLDLPFMLGGYFLGGLNGVLIGMAASRIMTCILMQRALTGEAARYGITIVLTHWRQELAVLWHFSVPAALAGAMAFPVNWVCSAILVNKPHGYAEMGAYSAASQWYNMLIFLPSVLGSGLLPILSDRMGDRDGKSSGKIISFMIGLNAAIVVPCAFVMSLGSPLIMRLYGAGYRDAWPTLIVVLWTAAIMALIAPVGDVIAASGKMWIGFVMNSGWAAVFIAFTVLLAPRGSIGLASSRLIAYAFHAAWTLGFARLILRRNHAAV